MPQTCAQQDAKEAIKKERIEVFFLDFLVVIELFHNEISE
jgi:hypothetical protein